MPTNTPESPSADDHAVPERPAVSRSPTQPEPPPHEVKERFRQSREYRHAFTTLVVLAIFTGVFLITSLASFVSVLGKSDSSFDFDRRWWLLPACSAAIGLLLAVLIFVRWSIANREWEDRLDDEEKENLRRTLEEQLPQTDQKLQRLIDANRALLDKYQEPVRKQARTSYAYAQGAITVGLVVLLVGAAITVAVSDTPTQVGIAALTGVGTVLSGYIARTYLRVYDRAQLQLNFYFREPLVTSYLLTAERLAKELQGEQRDSAYSEMVTQIVGGLGGELGPLVEDDSDARGMRRGKRLLRRESSDSNAK
jgi:hypothetical protein